MIIINNDFEQLIEQAIAHNQLGHAYIVHVSGSYEQKLLDIIKKIMLSSNTKQTEQEISLMLKKGSHPDYECVQPDGQWIKKEQIIKLKEKFSTKSAYSGARIYVLDKAENLNKSSENSMLKFLEEPEEKIVGILLTNNVNKVIKTISSRCQNSTLNCIPKEEDHTSKGIIEELNEIVTNDNNRYNIFLKMFNGNDKDILNSKLLMLLNIYSDQLNDILQNEESIESSENSKSICYKMKVIVETLDNLEYNVNIKLAMDKLYYKMFGDDIDV